MTPRATPMSPDDRRASVIEATRLLLLEHGRGVTTRQIAERAGVAEGTIFRVFESKDDLLTATVEHVLDFSPLLAELEGIDRSRDLRDRLVDLAIALQARFTGVFEVMTAVGMTGPPRAHRHHAEHRRRADELMTDLVAPDADRLTVRPEELAHMVRMLIFSGSHPHLSGGRRLSPEQVVSALLDGVLRKDRN